MSSSVGQFWYWKFNIFQNFWLPTSIMLAVTLATRFKFWSPKSKFGRPGHHFSRQNWALPRTPLNQARQIFYLLLNEYNNCSHFIYIYCRSDNKFCVCTSRIGGVMVTQFFSVLASSAVDRGFEPRSGQIKDHIISICCFSTKHAVLRRKNKDWFARNQDNVSESGDMSTCGLLFQWASTIKIQPSMLV